MKSQAKIEPLLSVPVRDAASRFLREHADGAPLYPGGSLASAAAVERRARKLDDAPDRLSSADRAAWLTEQNAFAPLHAAQAQSLAAAADPRALFVLTGQQPGLLGGPALGFCKAMTAVAWARTWSARLNRPVIPIFWVAGDDSDLAESNAVEFLEPGALSSSVALEFPDPDEAIPMSLRKLSADAARALRDRLPANWPGEAKALAEESYAPGRSLTEAFRHLMQRLLGGEGVLFVDGLAAARRPQAQSILRRVTADIAGFQESLLRGTARLRETLNLPAQVPVRPGTAPLFLFRDDRRVRLFASDSGRVYAAGDEGTDLRPGFSDPNSGSILLHTALTRPLVVESLFPVLGHVLGPAELRYFAQIADVFPAFGCSMPPLAPRRQAMMIPQAGLAALEAIGFRADELLDPRPSRVREHLTAEAWQSHPAAGEFPDADYPRFRDALGDYEARRFPRGNFDAVRRRLDRSFGHYREQARRLVFTEAASAKFQALQPLLRWLAGGLQDRHLNLLSLRAALGEGGFEKLTAVLRGSGGPGDYAEPVDTVSVFVLKDQNDQDDPEGVSR